MVADVPFDEVTLELNPYKMGMLVVTFAVVHATSRFEKVTRHCPVDNDVLQVWVKTRALGYAPMRTAIIVAIVMGLPASSKTCIDQRRKKYMYKYLTKNASEYHVQCSPERRLAVDAWRCQDGTGAQGPEQWQ
jgi:hypothetical protein